MVLYVAVLYAAVDCRRRHAESVYLCTYMDCGGSLAKLAGRTVD